MRVHGTGQVRLQTRVSPDPEADFRTTVLHDVLHIPQMAHNLVCHERVADAVRFALYELGDAFRYGRVEAPDFTLCYFRARMPGYNAGLVELGPGPPGYR